MSRRYRVPHTRLTLVKGHAVRMPAKCKKSGKINYADRIQADFMLGEIQKRMRRREVELKRSYKCNLCPYWHHTSQELYVSQMAHSA